MVNISILVYPVPPVAPSSRAQAEGSLSFDLPVRPIRPFRQAQGPDPSTMLRVMVRYSNHEALEGQAQSSTVVRTIRQAHGPEALEGLAHHPEEDRGEAHSKSVPEALEGEALDGRR